MITALLTLLIYLLILGVAWWAVDYLIATLPVPDPPARFIRIALVIIFTIVIIGLLLDMVGVAGLGLPRLR